VRPKPEIRCIDCGGIDCYERDNEGVNEIRCPDCGAVFGWGNLPKTCKKCRTRIYGKSDRGRGLCASCYVAGWSPEKRAAIDEAFKCMGEGSSS
jgi:hypothetical protein